MGPLGLFSGLVCSLIFLPNGKEVWCKEEGINEIKYLNKYKLTEMFLQVEPKNIQPLLEATTKVAVEYVNKIIGEDKDKRIVEKSITNMDRMGKRLKAFLKQLTDWKTTRIQLLDIIKNENDSKVLLEVTDETFKSMHKNFSWTIDNEIQFLGSWSFFGLSWTEKVGLTYINDDMQRSLKITKDYSKSFNKLFKASPSFRKMKEVKILKQILSQFYKETKKLQKSTSKIVKVILQLRIPDGIENMASNNCNAESKGVNLIRTDDGASFLAVCDAEWLVVAQRFDGSVNFTRYYEDYSIGFGNPPSEYFIGLDNFVSAASQDIYMLRFELTTWENETRTADYMTFDATPLDYADVGYYTPSWYSLRIWNFRGTAGNSLNYRVKYNYTSRNYIGFTNTGKCFKEEIGWWWGYCGKANLFGRYNHGPECDKAMDCMSWQAWPDQLLNEKDNKFYSFKAMRIMIRPLPIEAPPKCIKGVANEFNAAQRSDNDNKLLAKCEGQWLVVAHRFDGSIDFNRTWNEYKAGFGNISGEFFIGLQALFRLTLRNTFMVRFEMINNSGIMIYLENDGFTISDEHDRFRFSVHDFWENRRNGSFAYMPNTRFSTWDNDNNHDISCVQQTGGPFWHSHSADKCDTTWPSYIFGQFKFKDMKMMIKLVETPCGERKSGINDIHPLGGSSFKAKCEENWLMVAHRFDGSVDFYRTWAEYKTGFGDPSGEYFIGLNNLLSLFTGDRNYVLRLEFTTWDGRTETAEYYVFRLGWKSETSIRLEDFRGSGKDVISTSDYYHYTYDTINDYPFSTWDREDDPWTNCSALRRGAWWWYRPEGSSEYYYERGVDYKDQDGCGFTNPFGRYMNESKCDIEYGCMSWLGWPGELFSEAERKANKDLHNGWYSFKEMKFLIRPREPNWLSWNWWAY
ncbi:unnamed protein product [Owenia fusiformis]|uniref:Uncharacterized protein n=1 Tax=Owenia fusiformis TaxID=6347 RepID=A0A8J1UHW1_OWEFU|nr:unnamed protein product [Owenia fusiformis]